MPAAHKALRNYSDTKSQRANRNFLVAAPAFFLHSYPFSIFIFSISFFCERTCAGLISMGHFLLHVRNPLLFTNCYGLLLPVQWLTAIATIANRLLQLTIPKIEVSFFFFLAVTVYIVFWRTKTRANPLPLSKDLRSFALHKRYLDRLKANCDWWQRVSTVAMVKVPALLTLSSNSSTWIEDNRILRLSVYISLISISILSHAIRFVVVAIPVASRG